MRREALKKIKRLFPDLADISVEFNPNCNRLSLGTQEIAGIDSADSKTSPEIMEGTEVTENE